MVPYISPWAPSHEDGAHQMDLTQFSNQRSKQNDHAIVCSLLSADAASLQQATVVNYLAQMLSLGRMQPFL